MLENFEAAPNLAVKDLAVAKDFYEGKLGLKAIHNEAGQVLVYETGGTKIFVYLSQFAGTNKATAMTWMVGGELEKTVKSLKEKGVTFEHYDMPGMQRNGDIHGEGNMRIAWFKDPDGNILALTSG
jgi:catechol 2,3-dioxygenase-like lactoylglutathione lyase family enzyme